MRQVEVLKKQGGPWIVLLVWNDRTSNILTAYRRKKHALIAARAVAMYTRSELVEKDRSGKIINKNSYGNDPVGRG